MRSADDLISLEEVRQRLGGMTKKALRRRLAEAEIEVTRATRVLSLISLAEFARLRDFLTRPTPAPAPHKPSPAEARRDLRRFHLAETKRILRGGAPSNCVHIDLERARRKAGSRPRQ